MRLYMIQQLIRSHGRIWWWGEKDICTENTRKIIRRYCLQFKEEKNAHIHIHIYTHTYIFTHTNTYRYIHTYIFMYSEEGVIFSKFYTIFQQKFRSLEKKRNSAESKIRKYFSVVLSVRKSEYHIRILNCLFWLSEKNYLSVEMIRKLRVEVKNWFLYDTNLSSS